MKKGVLSTIIATIGLFFVYWYHRNTAIQISSSSEMTMQQAEIMMSDISIFESIYSIIPISLGILGLLIGAISLKEKSKIGLLGIILSISIIILFFLPVWKYMITM